MSVLVQWTYDQADDGMWTAIAELPGRCSAVGTAATLSRAQAEAMVQLSLELDRVARLERALGGGRDLDVEALRQEPSRGDTAPPASAMPCSVRTSSSNS